MHARTAVGAGLDDVRGRLDHVKQALQEKISVLMRKQDATMDKQVRQGGGGRCVWWWWGAREGVWRWRWCAAGVWDWRGGVCVCVYTCEWLVG